MELIPIQLSQKHKKYLSYTDLDIIFPDISTCISIQVFYLKCLTPHFICVCLPQFSPIFMVYLNRFGAIKQKHSCSQLLYTEGPKVTVQLINKRAALSRQWVSHPYETLQVTKDTSVTRFQHFQSPSCAAHHSLTLTL